MNKPYIGIKRVLYGDALTSLPNGEKVFTAAMLAAMIATVGSASAKLKDIQNLHQDTWGYEESDPTVTEYINQLTGQPYYRDKEQAGTPTVNFTLGQYDLETKADLQGGEVVDGVWHRGYAQAHQQNDCCTNQDRQLDCNAKRQYRRQGKLC